MSCASLKEELLRELALAALKTPPETGFALRSHPRVPLFPHPIHGFLLSAKHASHLPLGLRVRVLDDRVWLRAREMDLGGLLAFKTGDGSNCSHVIEAEKGDYVLPIDRYTLDAIIDGAIVDA